MALPGVTLNVLDGNLGLQQGSNEQVVLFLGVCTAGTPNTIASYGDQTTAQTALGAGSLVEAVSYALQVGGGPVMAMPLTPDTAGALGSVTQVGSGPAVTLTAGPYKAVTITCVTSGTIAAASAQFTFNVGGTVSAPVTAAAAWSSTGYRIPGTYTTYVFTTGSYTTSDVYTISTTAALAHSAGAGPAVGTQSSSPIDNYNALITVTKGGANGTGQFTYSLDNGETNLGGGGKTSASIVSPSSGGYAIPDSGVIITFATGTLVLGDTYTFKTATASSSDLSSALTALQTTYLSQASTAALGAVIQTPVSAAAMATQAAALETHATAMFNLGVFQRFIQTVPTVGSVFASGSAVVVDSADTDSVLIAARLSISAPHVVGGAGDCLLFSPLSGLTLRRAASWTAAARASAVEASQNIGFVGLGGLTGVSYIFRDENATQGLDAAGYTTMRKFPGLPGFFFTDAHTFSASTSDYYPFTNARVIDIGCTVVLANAQPLVNGKIPTKTDSNGNVGVITEKKAQQIEARIDGALETVMVATDPQNAVAASVTVNRLHNILADGQLILGVGIQPFAYSRFVTVNIGLAVAA